MITRNQVIISASVIAAIITWAIVATLASRPTEVDPIYVDSTGKIISSETWAAQIDPNRLEFTFAPENLDWSTKVDTIDLDANSVDIIPLDPNQICDLQIYAVGGEQCTVKSIDGVLHFAGDINTFINVVFDSVQQSPIGTHTKPLVFEIEDAESK